MTKKVKTRRDDRKACKGPSPITGILFQTNDVRLTWNPLPPPPNEHIHYMHVEKCWPRNAGIVYMMRYTWWCLAIRSILGRPVMSLALQKGFSHASSWAGLERTFLDPPFALRITDDSASNGAISCHEDRESALQKTSTNSGLAMNASPWAKFVILWISSSPKRPGSHVKPHAAVQKCRFFFQTNKLRPSPLSNEHRSFETKCW